MPSPSETLIWIEEFDPPYVSISFGHYSWQNQTNIRRRVERLLRRYSRGWNCFHCGKLMPVWKRVDAQYCSESCRKFAARLRRKLRMGNEGRARCQGAVEVRLVNALARFDRSIE